MYRGKATCGKDTESQKYMGIIILAILLREIGIGCMYSYGSWDVGHFLEE